MGFPWPSQAGCLRICSSFSLTGQRHNFCQSSCRCLGMITSPFAIVGAIVGMFSEMRLPPSGKRPYDPAIAEGYIGISVSVPDEERFAGAAEVMRQAGALRVIPEATP